MNYSELRYERLATSSGLARPTSEVPCYPSHLFFSQERWAEAKQHCDTALELAPGDVKALYRRAVAAEKLGDVQQAFKDMATAAKYEPSVGC